MVSLLKTNFFPLFCFFVHNLKKQNIFIDSEGQKTDKKQKKLPAKLKKQPYVAKAWQKLGWSFLTLQGVKGSDSRVGHFDSITPW